MPELYLNTQFLNKVLYLKSIQIIKQLVKKIFINNLDYILKLRMLHTFNKKL